MPLVTKNTRSAPKARAAASWAFLMLPVGSSRLSSPPVVADDSARNSVGPVELAHVADPVRLEDRLAARDRQRVEGADRLLRVLLEVVEERRLEALRHAGQDREVDLERLLDLVEDAADVTGRRGIAGDLLHVAPAQQVDVELRADALERGGQPGPVLLRRARVGVQSRLRREQFAQDGRVVPGRERKSVADHHGLDGAVEQRGEERVLEAADHDALVDELILRPAQAAEVLRDPRPARRRRRGDDQELEIRPPRLARVEAGGRRSAPGPSVASSVVSQSEASAR